MVTRASLDNVSTPRSNKEVLVNVRLREETRDEFKVAADLRGSTMSGLLHQFIIRTIREEKAREPEAFDPSGAIPKHPIRAAIIGDFQEVEPTEEKGKNRAS